MINRTQDIYNICSTHTEHSEEHVQSLQDEKLMLTDQIVRVLQVFSCLGNYFISLGT